MVAYWSEGIGTAVLVLIGNAGVASCLLKNSKGKDAGWLAITLIWGLAILLALYAAGPLSLGHLNPAVTLGLAINGLFPWEDVPAYILSQLLGGMVGSLGVYLFYYPHLQATKNEDLKLSIFSTGPAIPHVFFNFFAEFFATMILLISILSVSYVGGDLAVFPFIKPIFVALIVVALGLAFGGPTGYALNPARDFGPRLMHWMLPMNRKGPSNFQYAWVPILGPILGAAAGIYLHGYWVHWSTLNF